MSKQLPPKPNLKNLKLQAKRLHKAHAEGLPAAFARIGAHYPPLTGKPEAEVRAADFGLCNAQMVVAREYGFESWRKMVATAFPQRTRHERQACACCGEGQEDPTRVFLRIPYGAWLCRACAAACRTVHQGGADGDWSSGGRCSWCRRTEDYGTPVAFHDKMGLCGDCLAHIAAWPVEKETLRERGREEQLQILQGNRETAHADRSVEMIVEWGDELWRLHQAGLPDAVARVAAALPDRPADAPLTLEAARDALVREVVGGFENWAEYKAKIDEVQANRGRESTPEQLAERIERDAGTRVLGVERYAYEAPGEHEVYTAFRHYVDGALCEDTRKALRRRHGWREQLLCVAERRHDDGHRYSLYFDQTAGGRDFSTRGRGHCAWKSVAGEVPVGAMTPVLVLVANAEREPRIDGLTVEEIIAANELVVVACVEVQLLA